MRRCGFTILALCLSIACGSSGNDATDVGADVQADLPGDLPGEAAPADVPGEAPVELPGELAETTVADGDETSEAACTAVDAVPQPPIDPTGKKFALSMFHFNMQYVAGGLVADLDGQHVTMCDNFPIMPLEACDGWNDDKLNDWEIDVAFAPTLDLFLKHPEWKTTFEIPGIMMEVMGERHPEVTAKLRQAAQSGQVEVVSFHWSAQLFLAFPKRDLEQSLEMTREVFAKYCIPLSGVVFNQEGQDGEGKHAFMAAAGLAIDLMHVNQFGYVQRGLPLWPYYKSHGVDVVIGPPLIDGNADMDPAAGIQVKWTFFDDGELLSAPGNPYFAPVTPEPDAGSLSLFENKVQGFADQGFKVTTLTDYVAQLKAQAVEQKALPLFLEGTWQPIDTDGIHLWMGGRGRFPWATAERDNFIRTASIRAGQGLAAAEVLIGEVKKAGIDITAAMQTLAAGWRALLKAEVSDATGINPFQGEFVYGRDNNAAALAAVDEIVTSTLAALKWPHATIDLASWTATKLDALPIPGAPLEAAAPLVVTVDAPTREATTKWYGGPGDRYQMVVSFGAGGDPTGDDVTKRTVTVTFPRTEDKVIITPALTNDAVVEYPFTAFVFRPDADYISKTADLYVPAANGLIGLGSGWWVIRDNTTVMIAPRIPVKAQVVQFIDQTADPVTQQTWIFQVMKGTAADALAAANRLNETPIVTR